MIFLAKTDQAAISHVSDFIDNNWLEQNDGTYKYQNISYSQVKYPVFTFRGYFVGEQGNKCCYCCRKIENDHTTELEHIIPRTKFRIDQFEPYHVLSDILRTNVVPQADFETSTVPLNKPPFPHHIAYHNILASCDGRTFEASSKFTCCNRERKDIFIPPFNLMEGAVQYLPDGTIVYMTEIANRDYFEILNLSKNLLVNIRRLWYLFSLSRLTAEEVTNVEGDNLDVLKEHIITNAVGNSSTIIEDIRLIESFTNENTWYTFKQYDYFFDYYRGGNAVI